MIIISLPKDVMPLQSRVKSYEINIGNKPLERAVPLYGDEFLDWLWEQTEKGDASVVLNEVLGCLHKLWYSKPFQENAWIELIDIGNEVFQRAEGRLQEAFTRIVFNKKRRGDLLQVCETRMNFLRVLAMQEPERALRLLERERSTLPFKGIFVPSANPRVQRDYYAPDQDERLVLQTYLLNLDVEILAILQRTRQSWGLQVETGHRRHEPSRNGKPAHEEHDDARSL